MTDNFGNIVLTNAVHWLRALLPKFSSPDMHLASLYKKESLNLGVMKRSKAGFTIVEVLVALAIFSIGGLSVAAAFGHHLATNTRSEVRTGAIIAVNQVLEQLRVSDITGLPTTGRSLVRSVTVGPVNYDVYVTYCSPSTYCTSNAVRVIKAEARVHNETRYEVETVFAQLR